MLERIHQAFMEFVRAIAPLQAIAHELAQHNKLLARQNELFEAYVREQGIFVPDKEKIDRLKGSEVEVELMYGTRKAVFPQE